MEEIRLTSLVRSSGCNAKLPPGDLHKALDNLEQVRSSSLIEGFESSDDALVYDIGDKALIETVDFFPPMVGYEPYVLPFVSGYKHHAADYDRCNT